MKTLLIQQFGEQVYHNIHLIISILFIVMTIFNLIKYRKSPFVRIPLKIIGFILKIFFGILIFLGRLMSNNSCKQTLIVRDYYTNEGKQKLEINGNSMVVRDYYTNEGKLKIGL